MAQIDVKLGGGESVILLDWRFKLSSLFPESWYAWRKSNPQLGCRTLLCCQQRKSFLSYSLRSEEPGKRQLASPRSILFRERASGVEQKALPF